VPLTATIESFSSKGLLKIWFSEFMEIVPPENLKREL
jgi:hypothetical protein